MWEKDARQKRNTAVRYMPLRNEKKGDFLRKKESRPRHWPLPEQQHCLVLWKKRGKNYEKSRTV